MGRNRLISPLSIPKPNPKCYVCAPQPTIHVTVGAIDAPPRA